jgi:hypothetical protein
MNDMVTVDAIHAVAARAKDEEQAWPCSVWARRYFSSR